MTHLMARRTLVAAMVFILSLAIFWAGYSQENSEAYLFPIIIGLSMAVFSFVSLVREAFALCIEDFQEFPFRRQLPVILLMIAGISAIEWMGMYSTSFLLLLVVSYWYSAVEDNKSRFIRSLIFSGGFCVAMYLLFTVMLNVQLPRGWLL